MEGANGTSININYLSCTWSEKDERKKEYKRRRKKRKRGIKNQKRNTVSI